MPLKRNCDRCLKKYQPFSRSNRLCLDCRSKANHRTKMNTQIYTSKIFTKKDKLLILDLKKYYKEILNCSNCKKIFGSNHIKDNFSCPICIQKESHKKSRLQKMEERNANSK